MNRRNWLRLAGTSLGAGLWGCAATGGTSFEVPLHAQRRLAGTAHGIWQGGRTITTERPGERLGSLSLTKSIAALAVVRACGEGWLNLDTSLTPVLPEWRHDPEKSRITLRMLINQSAGFHPSPSILYRPTLQDKGRTAISLPLADPPAARFRYGPACWEITAEILHRQLVRQGGDLEKFLGQVIRRIGLSSPAWRRDKAGRHYLSTGAEFSVRELGKLGRTIGRLARGENDAGLDSAIFLDLASPRHANPMFGAGIWWNRNARRSAAVAIQPERVLDGVRDPSFWSLACLSPRADPGWLALVGSGGKRVYVLPEKDLVIARLGRTPGWDDSAFLDRLSS